MKNLAHALIDIADIDSRGFVNQNALIDVFRAICLKSEEKTRMKAFSMKRNNRSKRYMF